jgi:glycerol uptake facilitator-like aquaporin
MSSNTEKNKNESNPIQEVKSSYSEKSFSRKLGEASFEGLATFLFMCAIYFSKGKIEIFIFGMWVILSCFGGISGAHVNPAITLGFYAIHGDYIHGLQKLLLYTVFQLAGCILGAFLAFYVVQSEVVYIQPYLGAGKGNIFFSEFFLTGTFFFFIAFVCHEKYPPSNIIPLNTGIIVSWFYLIVNAGSKLSGAAFNPAVLITLNAFARFGAHKTGAFAHVWIMIAAQLAGVFVFALIFKYIFVPFYEVIHQQNEKKKLNSEEFQNVFFYEKNII